MSVVSITKLPIGWLLTLGFSHQLVLRFIANIDMYVNRQDRLRLMTTAAARDATIRYQIVTIIDGRK